MSENLNLSKDIETEGFDLQAGESWIYPTNYPVRDYQYNITQKALLKNTLVSLPTGLGKTFIAAVVMFNYYRWYPFGKVVFMAPTRPLVKQQIDACYDIMGIPKDCTVEITGAKLANVREEIWNQKRVFFITPQILQNDLDKFSTLASKIKCVVFDEAHRARGNHAYCEVIRKLTSSNKYFRVLALSATPGGTIEDVLEVVNNLLITHLEFRVEESIDVSPYVFKRNLTTVVVPLDDKLQEVRTAYMKILEHYTRTLMKYKIVQGNCANLTKGKIFMLMKNYQESSRGTSSNYSEIMKSLNICITLYHASELLIRHGLRSFLTFYEEHIDKPLLRNNMEIRELLSNVKAYMGPLPQIQQLPDGEYPEVPKNVKFGHPKFYKLRDILTDHFKKTGDSSRVIVFFEYRESVMEAYVLLIQSRPMLKPRIFIGQKQGVTQKSQINVVKAFREGRCNVLLSTSIGEEGLDVGEVDLIICFDISNKSPIRMVQRMGRTGRKKDGNIVVLVTEGKEQQTLKECLIHKNNVAFHVLGSNALTQGLNKECPRLVPDGIVPKCEKIFISIEKPVLTKGSNLKDLFRTISSKSSGPSFSPDLLITEIDEKLPHTEMFSFKDNPFDEEFPLSNVFSKKIEKQRSFQEVDTVEHSSNCELLVNLLQIAESRRFNIPMSQLNTEQQNKNLKQTDIRNMFLKTQSANDFILPSTQVIPEPPLPINLEEKQFGDPELFNELTNYLSIQMNDSKQCHLCPSQLNCGQTQYNKKPSTNNLIWLELDSSVFENITLEDLKRFEKELVVSTDSSFQFEESMNFQIPETPNIKINATQKETKLLELEDLIDSSILADFCNTTSNFQAPKSLNNLLNRYSTSLIDKEDIVQKETATDQTNIVSQTSNVNKTQKDILLSKNTKLEDTTVVRNVLNSKKDENIETRKTKLNRNKEYSEDEIKSILNFFKLDSIESMFEEAIPDSQDTVLYSPDIFYDSCTTDQQRGADRKEIASNDSHSPILCSYVNKKRPQKDQSLLTQSVVTVSSTPISQKSLQMPEVPFKKSISIDSSQEEKPSVIKEHSGATKKIDFDDLFDFSFFDLPAKTKDQTVLVSEQVISLTDSCTKSDFCEEPLKTPKNSEDHNNGSRLELNISDLENFCDDELLQSPVLSTRDNNKKTTAKSLRVSGGVNNNEKDKGKKSSDIISLDISDLCVEELFLSPEICDKNKNPLRKKGFSQVRAENDQENIQFTTNSDTFKIPLAIDRTKQNVDVETQMKNIEGFETTNKTRSTGGLKFSQLKNSNVEENPFPKKINSSSSYFEEPKSLDFLDFGSAGIKQTNKSPSNDFSSLRSQKNSVSDKSTLDKFKLSDIIDLETEETTSSPLNVLRIQKNQNRETNCTSQASITQIISMINSTQKKTQQKENVKQDISQSISMINEPRHNKSSQKENLKHDIPEFDEDFFDFTFNTKLPSKPKVSPVHCVKSLNPPAKKLKVKENTSRLDESLHNNSSVNTTLSSNSVNSSTSSEKSLKAARNLSRATDLNPDFSLNTALNDSLKKYLNSSASTSDDEFETKPKSPPLKPKGSSWMFSKPPLVAKRARPEEDSDDDFQTNATSPLFARPKPVKRLDVEKVRGNRDRDKKYSSHLVKRKKPKNPFIEDEAELSCNESIVSDDDEDEFESQQCYDESFVTDETQNNDTQMHAFYLKSVKSPHRPQRFKIPARFKHNTNIFSQPVEEEEEEWDLDDSFVVHDETIEEQEELSQLEILERELERQKKKTKRQQIVTVKPKKRKILIIDSDSD